MARIIRVDSISRIKPARFPDLLNIDLIDELSHVILAGLPALYAATTPPCRAFSRTLIEGNPNVCIPV